MVVHAHTYVHHGNTVDREMFAVKKFSPLAQVAKILRAKISRAQTARAIFARLIFAAPSVAKIKHAENNHAKKKERENFPIYGRSQIRTKNTKRMSKRRSERMTNASEKWRMGPSLP